MFFAKYAEVLISRKFHHRLQSKSQGDRLYSKLNTKIPRSEFHERGRTDEFEIVETTRKFRDHGNGVDSKRKLEETRGRDGEMSEFEIGGQVGAIVEREEKRHEARLMADYSRSTRGESTL